MAKPDVSARHRAACKAAWQRVLADPQALERKREFGRKIGQRNLYRYLDKEGQAKARVAISRGLAPWCPEDRLDDNRQLRIKGIPLADRKRMILEETPGTVEHARRLIANNIDVMRMKAERQKREAY